MNINLNVGVKTLLDLRPFGMWILRESHPEQCCCSHCCDFSMVTFGVALPECKARNSWRIIFWHKNGELQVLRWTLPQMGRPERDAQKPNP